jgi:choline dehydrogenase
MRADHELHDAFIQAAQEAGYKYNPDFNGAEQEGVGTYQLTVRKRRRASTAVTYLRPAMKRPNLKVEIRALAQRVIFDGKRAIGLEYRQDGQIRRARARREVLLAGGSLQSPQLLQLSGIGPAGLLRHYGLDVVHELPGVGENLQDHIGCRVIYKVKKANTINEISRSWLRQGKAGLEYLLAGKGPLMMGAAPIGLFARARPTSASPDCQYQFLAGSLDAPGKPMHPFPACSLVCIPCRPESRGWLRIKSPDPAVFPAMQPNYLATQNDKDTMVAGLRLARSIFQTPTMQAIITEEFWPGADKDSDEDWLEHVRNTGSTTFHQTSTCMMGDTPLSVVDNELRVHGIGGLRVVDASVMPTVISGNTNAATIMIAEKAADLISAETGATAKAA